MRIAWIGPMPSEGGGAGGVSNLLLREFNERGIDTDCYVPGHEHNLPTSLRGMEYVHFICAPSSWEWNRWYSRNRLMGFVTGQIANLLSEDRLARMLMQNHRDNPYDIVYQFSHIEFSKLRNFRSELPPIFLHPSVHAYGELKSMRSEIDLAKACEPIIMRIGARLLVSVRSFVQKRHIRYADFVLALSENFAKDLNQDYGVPLHKIQVVPNPIDVATFVSGSSTCHDRLIILFVSRISVRKGVEMVIELSHRLDDLRDQVEIQIIGDKSMWSDYTRLLSKVNHRVARFVGQINSKHMHELYQSADILVQPSHYEPFGLTVAEALASGLPVVASDKVGAAEHVDPVTCRKYRDGDMDAFESQVRELVSDMREPSTRNEIRYLARDEAFRLFNVQSVTSHLVKSLDKANSLRGRTSREQDLAAELSTE